MFGGGAALFGLFPVLVRGPSMAPTLRDGDAVLARRGGRPPRPGDVVLGRFRSPAGPAGDQAGRAGGAATAGGWRATTSSSPTTPGRTAWPTSRRAWFSGGGRGPAGCEVADRSRAMLGRCLSRRRITNRRRIGSEPVFELHRGGKMAVQATVPLSSREDLSLAYTPGVAKVCEAIAAEPGAGPGLHLDRAHRRRGDRRLRGARAGQHRCRAPPCP